MFMKSLNDLSIYFCRMESKVNPWNVKSLDEFLVQAYSCPECDALNLNKNTFVSHAIVEHPACREFIVCIDTNEQENEAEPIELEQSSSDLSESDQDSEFEVPEVTETQSCIVTNTEGGSNNVIEYTITNQSICIEKVCEQTESEKMEIECDPDSKEKAVTEISDLAEGLIDIDKDTDEIKIELDEQFEQDEQSEQFETTNEEIESENHDTSNINHEVAKAISRFHCEKCDQTYSTKDFLYRHMDKSHGIKNSWHQCNKCQKLFMKRSSMEAHRRNCTKKVKYPCKQQNCCETFPTRILLNIHEQSVHNIEQEVLKCEQCESSFLTQSGLRKHVKTNHEQPPINSPNVEPFVKRITRVTGKQVLANKAIELNESEDEETFKCGH